MKVDVTRLQANVDRAHQSGYVVREMRSQDAGDIARVHVQVWRQAYADLMPAEFLAAMDLQASTDRWRELLEQDAAQRKSTNPPQCLKSAW